MTLESLIALVVVLAILLVVIALRPAGFRYVRSATIVGSPVALFEQVHDLHQFQAWNPWAAIGLNSNFTVSGPPAGVGAAFSWAGKNEVGEGTMTLPGELARLRIEFRKPMAGVSTAELTFRPDVHAPNP